MVILIVLLTTLSSIFAGILNVQKESQSTSTVDLDARFIIAKLIHDMQSMQTGDTITSPASPGQSGSSLTFSVNSINQTYSLSNGNLVLSNSSGTNNLNGVDTIISALQFMRIGEGTNSDTIRVSFTITSRVNKDNGPETRNYQTTISSQ